MRTKIMGQVQESNRLALEQNVELLKRQLAALPGDEDELRRLTTRTRRQALVKQIRDVEKQVAATKAKAEQPGEVLRTAPLPERRDDPERDISGATGLGLGLLGWIGYVLVRETRPRRIRRPADLRLHSRHPIMVEAATLGGGHREVARRLRNLVFDAEATTVLVAGVPGTAGTEIAYELAELCTEGGSPTTVLRIAAQGEGAEPERPGRAPRSFNVRLVRSDDDRQLTRAVDKAGPGVAHRRHHHPRHQRRRHHRRGRGQRPGPGRGRAGTRPRPRGRERGAGPRPGRQPRPRHRAHRPRAPRPRTPGTAARTRPHPGAGHRSRTRLR
ncbi:hypothetical protein [Actinomadura madurae]|uniref:hypothetical protein n=1 Tax=Actinomadura madurae TaxID=1993 RepID=UPI0020D25049|nr:hypothetical protein [Actinomadura madurae]MCP9979537.1 hypothetical protein [Actinomadura madurae]